MSTATQSNWAIDAAHSEITFKIRHLVISNITGKFDRFEASAVSSTEDFSNAQFNFSAEIDSINTNNEQRDGHLKSDDFFNLLVSLNFVVTNKCSKMNIIMLKKQFAQYNIYFQ